MVVNLTGRGDSARRMTLGTTEWTLTPRELNLSTLDAAAVLEEVAHGQAPREVLAWIPVLKNGGEDATIRRWLEIAGAETDLNRRGDYALARVFARLDQPDAHPLARQHDGLERAGQVVDVHHVHAAKLHTSTRASANPVRTTLDQGAGSTAVCTGGTQACTGPRSGPTPSVQSSHGRQLLKSSPDCAGTPPPPPDGV